MAWDKEKNGLYRQGDKLLLSPSGFETNSLGVSKEVAWPLAPDSLTQGLFEEPALPSVGSARNRNRCPGRIGKFSSKIVNQEVCALQKDIATVGMAQTEHEDRKGAIADL